MFSSFFFFNDTATTEIYTLSLHDALPILSSLFSAGAGRGVCRGYVRVFIRQAEACAEESARRGRFDARDRKSTRLNSSHANISYAVFCLKKKKNKQCNIKFYQQQLLELSS